MSLPVHAILPELRQALAHQRRAVLIAPPGSGKTTVAPPALLGEDWLKGQKIVMLEPRRLAARLAARFMAESLGEEVGGTVGYRVRFDSRVSAATRIEVVTEGVFLRRLQNDPSLEGVGLVVFDEFHERGLDADLALALCLDAADGLREDLGILVMSATMDAEAVANLLGNAPVVRGEGWTYPVELVYLPAVQGESRHPADIAQATNRAVRQALAERKGDLLVFLPGMGEIRRTADLLVDLNGAGLAIRPLHGGLPLAEQARAVRPEAGRQRVILATNVAETSITIEGVSVVVDSGWRRGLRQDQGSGLGRLATQRISLASAEQRRGRAGRLGPGCCYRLWSAHVEQGMADFDRAEILDADLAPLFLELRAWGAGRAEELRWLDPPPGPALAAAGELLERLGAVDAAGAITRLGVRMAALPLHPRLAAMVVRAGDEGQAGRACDLAALLAERDIIEGRDPPVDLDERLLCLETFRRNRQAGPDCSAIACRRVLELSRRLAGLLGRDRAGNGLGQGSGALLALAFPDRVAMRRADSRDRYLLASGRGARLPAHDRLAGSPFLVVAAMDAGHGDGRVFLAAAIDRKEIEARFAKAMEHYDEVRWEGGRILALRRQCLGGLVLAEQPLTDPDPEALRQALLAAIRASRLELLPWTPAARALQARVDCLARALPEEAWPDLGDEALLAGLDQWLGPWLLGLRKVEGLRALQMERILIECLDWEQRRRLDAEAPTHLRIPDGSRPRLRYAPGEAPVLAARVQQLFGLADSPAICRGRVAVVVHLLSPANRPIQITRDLRGFWNSGYHEVKKELKGRYPKHPWPDDPWTAPATNRTKPKKNNL